MTRPRAADDFAVIRARIDELRRERVTRSRAADDFAAIRARLEELRRERAQASTEREDRSMIGPRRCHVAGNKPEPEDRRRLPDRR